MIQAGLMKCVSGLIDQERSDHGHDLLGFESLLLDGAGPAGRHTQATPFAQGRLYFCFCGFLIEFRGAVRTDGNTDTAPAAEICVYLCHRAAYGPGFG